MGFGPMLASRYLVSTIFRRAKRWYGIEKCKPGCGEAESRLSWRSMWCQRLERFGELVQRKTRDHALPEGRGERIYLITMIDDAGSRMFALVVRHDSTETNMALLQEHFERFGRPLEFYSDRGTFSTPHRRIIRSGTGHCQGRS